MEDQNAQLEKVSTRSAGIRYGLMMAVLSIAFFMIMNVADLDMQGPVGYLSWVITAAMLFLAHKYYKDEGDGFMTIGQGVGIGFWAGMVSSVISSIFTYVYVKFIDDGFLQAIKDKQIESMQERGMSDEQIDQAMQFAGAFSTPEAILGFGIVFGIIGGVIIGLLVALFTKKSNPDLVV
ncbi:MAG TPA: DUF4199 domain-containing protein [Cyclobacteriaceae bacterium]|nr:DUF4199 domain-containing protein [Cyclobacteriaceae bacterium]HPW64006.1 DUF4199 domain-containing protein [Cyclobacteriaceae bacterium]